MQGQEDHSFSAEGIGKKVNEELLTHSMTLYPAAGGVLALLYGGLFSSTAGFIAGGIGIIASGGFYLYQKITNGKKLSQKHIDNAREEQKKELISKLATLGPELRDLGCEQGALQVDQLNNKFVGLLATIDEKLSNKSVEASRLHALAEKLYLATIDNLIHAKQILKSIKDIDLDYIETQLARAHNTVEKESLEERRRLKIDGSNAAEECIANNEIAMTKINLLSMNLARSKRNSKFNMEQSLHEITNNVRTEQWEME